MIKNILKYPQDEEALSQISKEVTDINDIQELIQDLKDTMHATNNGRGISAIQIGVPLRVCIINWGGEFVLINPTITRRRGDQEFQEGCLSVPGIFQKIHRSQKVWCTYTDENGETKELAEGGWTSAIIQHELDHMDGKCELTQFQR